MKTEDPEIFESGERSVLDTLQLVIAHDERGQPAQSGEDVGRQNCDLVIAQIPEKK